ncbi:prolyl oligopeptidase family serine peptidase [Prevotella sp. S7 MS 2]|uniref:S9 family peptidase n=1 Tax=Prevotella sp. S7 MS 2 TaxID=1287488 RepID=UPI0005144022|nr:prolyl oligopeptidase family serine peptidase [Prevotella sp. S7 MS 2]KGI59997.1 peptidase S9 [Prevotella sp. S7 MS 2]
MKKSYLFLLACLFLGLDTNVYAIDVNTFRYQGPYAVYRPLMLDSIDINAEKFSDESLLKTSLMVQANDESKIYTGKQVPTSTDAYALHLLKFNFRSRGYVKGQISVTGLKSYEVTIDGQSAQGEQTFLPGTHLVTIKYMSRKGRREALKVSVKADKESLLSVDADAERSYSLGDVLDGKRFSGVSLSHDGRYQITSYRITEPEEESYFVWRLTEVATGKLIIESLSTLKWVPGRNAYYVEESLKDGVRLTMTDIETGQQRVLATRLPIGASFMISPTLKDIIVSNVQQGPAEHKDIYQIVEPDDRQPGWRDRKSLGTYKVETGILQPLTFGFHNVVVQDISTDGRYLLIMTSRSRLTKRPTTLYSLIRIDLQEMKSETLVADDGFIADAKFSPDGRSLVVKGSPESFGGVGKNVPEGRIPSMYDYQLYTLDIATRHVMPLTRSFNPSIAQYEWSRADGQIYFSALDKDYCRLFRLSPADGKIVRIDVPEDMVTEFSLANQSDRMAWCGMSASNSDRLYLLNTKSGQSELVEDLSRDILKGVKLGKCEAWDFVNSRGDTISGRFYLPADFNPAKKYPLIVNYYGGCSPTSRNFESRYPQHLYAAMGYVVYVINPSGATGFGQEFASRHVATAGQGVAEDIIEGTRKFCEVHPYINTQKIGCIGASYGGFMTQYLQTRTDLFAAAISHAGISDHTSYWGEGYWGYSYSEVSMGDRYPWSDRKLYVNQSPLFNADKIHTPLLFLHGSADHNVPLGESIQMFNALKLLGRPTAFVVVDGQDHHILDYKKRVKWQNTIFAWFAKYLQDDSAWWDSLYPKVAIDE